MILSGYEILRRLNAGEIFRKDSWDKTSVKEASYALRIAGDGLLVGGTFFEPQQRYEGDYIHIEPGQIAILSTIERVHMPANLVGRIGIRLKYALQGLTGLMGIQVDPLYGQLTPNERLYIRVVNFGNESIRLSPGAEVFTFELQQVHGSIPELPKQGTWERIKDALSHQSQLSWSYITKVDNDVSKQRKDIRRSLQPVVMFGVFLVAVTILGVALSVILAIRNTPEVQVPNWVTHWGWILILISLSFATFTTGLMGLVTIWQFSRNK